MAPSRISEWRKLSISLAELCVDTTLRCGQSFRWKKLRDNEWTCALHGQLISLKQDSTHLHYRSSGVEVQSKGSVLPTAQALPENVDTEILIRRYLNLETNLSSLYAQWSLADPNFKRRAPNFLGVRILKQDPWEALLGFICSSNNNISRISSMISNLCLHYGSLVGYVDGQAFHDFPPPEALVGNGVESRLRELGFGYRAGYISKTALMVSRSKPEGWLQSLCNPESAEDLKDGPIPQRGREGYRRAHAELLQLPGVGPKVADCVCLMGLGWGEAVPVDTHVWQIAQRDYKFGKGKHKGLTKATYDAIGDYFRQLWGKEAGWAHSVLFAADLRTFAEKEFVEIQAEVADGVINSIEKSPGSRSSLKREHSGADSSSILTNTTQIQQTKRRKR